MCAIDLDLEDASCPLVHWNAVSGVHSLVNSALDFQTTALGQVYVDPEYVSYPLEPGVL